MTCQYNEYDKPRGCRKRARVSVVYSRLFGMRVTGKGDEKVYTQAVSRRCEEHAKAIHFGSAYIGITK